MLEEFWHYNIKKSLDLEDDDNFDDYELKKKVLFDYLILFK